MSVFNFSAKELDFISSKLGLQKHAVKIIDDEYSREISGLMKKQYLAHCICAIEQFLYVQRKKKSVHVMLQELDIPTPMYLDFCPDFEEGYFIVYYPENYSSKEIRMSVAHELGHLFFNTKKGKELYGENDQRTLEGVANVFGLFLILGRNELYSEKRMKSDVFQGKSWRTVTKEYAEFCGIATEQDRGKEGEKDESPDKR